MKYPSLVFLALSLGSIAPAQVCLSGQTCLTNDVLPCNLSGSPTVAVIRGLCVGDKAACVFDLSSWVGPVQIHRGGILFSADPAAPAPNSASGRMEIYDGLMINSNGSVVLGPLVYGDPFPINYMPNTLQMRSISTSNVQVTSGKMVLAFSMDTNNNGNCSAGYLASFASDSNAPTGAACMSAPGRNLIFDSAQGWWDISRFRIGATPWCGLAFNGNWIMRACVTGTPAPFPGTGEDLTMMSSVNLGMLDPGTLKTVTATDFFNVQVTSPSGTFLLSPALVLADLYLTGTTPPPDLLPGLHMGAFFFTLASTPTLTPLGVPYSLVIPTGAAGLSLRFQGVSLALAAAQNGLFASTRAHIALIQ